MGDNIQEEQAEIKSLKLNFLNNKAIRSNGRAYSRKEDVNRFFYPEEYMKFEDALKPRQRHTIKFLLSTGARIDEARHIKVGDVDFVNKRIAVRKVKRKAAKGESRGKMRTIPISSQFCKYLKLYCDRNKKTDEDDFNLLSTPAVKICMKNTATKLGFKNPGDFSAHTLRKTLEVWLMALGVYDIPLTAHFGHDIRTAASHYVSPDVFSNQEKMMIRNIIGDLYYGLAR